MVYKLFGFFGENFINEEGFPKGMDKRGQLGIIEFKYFLGGLVVGIIIALVLVLLGQKEIIPFQVPLVCG